MKDGKLRHVQHLWLDEEAAKLSGVDRLVYRSNKLGSDLTLTNTGGGNTSSKLMETDPLTGESVEVLWVKGSGGDLRTAKRDSFASLYIDRVRAMKARYLADPSPGPKTKIEDDMYDQYRHCVFDLNPRACSIDTPLHTFVPRKHVDHLHPNSVIAIAASVDQARLCKAIYGDDVIYIPWQRPGFDLGLSIESLISANPRARGVLLGHHGMSSWGDDDKACYETALEIIDRAAAYIEERDRGDKTFGGPKYGALADDERRRLLVEIVPWLRGQMSGAPGSWLRFRTTRTSCALPEASTARAWPTWEPPVRITSCGRRSSRFSSSGTLRAATSRRFDGPHRGPRPSTAETTKPTISAASAPRRPPCAIPIPRSC